jgi:hypothetical protein
MERLPSVTALIPAHDAEAFVEHALRSALAQDYPPELLDVVVVDDGSTDATAAVVERVAASAGGRVRLVRQENRGLVGAVNRAAAEATDSELLALLDADDAWPADKIRRQVAVLRARPEVGLVYTDMRVIDAEGRVLDESWLAGSRPPRGREVGALLEENRVTASSIVVRASLRDHLFPIPAELPWADWWLAVRTALVAEIAYLDEPKTSYRWHGANMSLGTQGTDRLRELRGALGVQRWFLRRLTPEQVAVGELEQAWVAFGRMAGEALTVAGSPFARLVEVTDADRGEAAELCGEARRALGAGDVDAAVGLAIRAAACDPSDDDARGALLDARAARPAGHGAVDPLRDGAGTIVCLQADEVLRTPSLLVACADAVRGMPDVTVAIDASEADVRAAEREIAALVAEQGLAEDETVDLLLVTGPLDELARARMTRRVDVHVGARRPPDARRHVGVHELAALQGLVAARSGASVDQATGPR